MVFRVLDIARRVHDHTWKLDPIVRSLLDTDFYKLMMLQMIWKLHRDVDATFSLINRTTSIRLADEIDIGELRDQIRTFVFDQAHLRGLPTLMVTHDPEDGAAAGGRIVNPV